MYQCGWGQCINVGGTNVSIDGGQCRGGGADVDNPIQVAGDGGINASRSIVGVAIVDVANVGVAIADGAIAGGP